MIKLPTSFTPRTMLIIISSFAIIIVVILLMFRFRESALNDRINDLESARKKEVLQDFNKANEQVKQIIKKEQVKIKDLTKKQQTRKTKTNEIKTRKIQPIVNLNDAILTINRATSTVQ